VERVATLSWDPPRDDLRARIERRLDNLVLAEHEGPAEPGPATSAALLARVRATKLQVLNWSEAARSLQFRTAFARRIRGTSGGPAEWPDLSDDALLAGAEDWLVPLLANATGRADLEAIDMATVLRRMLGHRVGELDRVAPATIAFAGGRQVPVSYTGNEPAAEVRVQDAFGTTTHPTVGGVPVVLSLLSPAGRPIQVTADLPGFWQGSWADVRKDMAGRYPKHSWPPDAATASPPRQGPGRHT
jgi:ATP-dependent helicase HrpB